VTTNLALGDNLDQTLHDLHLATSHHDLGYLLDLTTRFHGLNLDKLKAIQTALPSVKLLYGYTPKVNYVREALQVENASEKVRGEIEFEMKNGVKQVLPSFIGEIIVKDMDDKYTRVLLEEVYRY
jgi:hypothetical protein